MYWFGIIFYRDKWSKDVLNIILEIILGIGEKIVEEFLKYFKSIKCIGKVFFDELEVVVGVSRVKKIIIYF